MGVLLQDFRGARSKAPSLLTSPHRIKGVRNRLAHWPRNASYIEFLLGLGFELRLEWEFELRYSKYEIMSKV